MLMPTWSFQPNTTKDPRKKRIFVILIVVIILVVAGGAAAWYLVSSNNRSSEAPTTSKQSEQYKKASSDIKAATLSDEEVATIVRDYGANYDRTLEEVQKSNPSKWDQSIIDKAHFCLLYADKVGSRSQVESLYYQIYAAQQSGINVDTNSAGVTQQQREEMFERNKGESGA